MQFIDPMPIECPACGEIREYAVDDLLNFRARCYVCNHDLASVGNQMRECTERAGQMWNCAMFLLDLEDKLGIEYENKDLEDLHISIDPIGTTFNDVFCLTAAKLPHNAEERLKQQILETAAELSKIPLDRIHLGMKLVEALD